MEVIFVVRLLDRFFIKTRAVRPQRGAGAGHRRPFRCMLAGPRIFETAGDDKHKQFLSRRTGRRLPTHSDRPTTLARNITSMFAWRRHIGGSARRCCGQRRLEPKWRLAGARWGVAGLLRYTARWSRRDYWTSERTRWKQLQKHIDALYCRRRRFSTHDTDTTHLARALYRHQSSRLVDPMFSRIIWERLYHGRSIMDDESHHFFPG